MTRKATEGGFTLIEVILFLAIAGLMLSGVLVGVSGSISRERYDDAVASFQDYLRGQYNLADNVRNNRPADRPCDAPGGVPDSPVAPSGEQARGSSECAIVGRFVSSADGVVVTSKPVFATGASYSTDGTEAELLNSLVLQIAPDTLVSDDDDYDLAWDTKIYTNPADKATSNNFSLLILRLPTNGLTRTYTAESVVTNLPDFWASAPADLKLCIEPDGLIGSGIELGVRVKARGASSAAVQRITSGEGAC